MSTIFQDEFAALNREFMEYIAQLRKEVQEYSQKIDAKPYYIQKQNEKLWKLKTFKDRYGNIMDNLLKVMDDSFERGKKRGMKLMEDEKKLQENPYIISKDGKNRESLRIMHNSKQKEKWADHY